MRKRLDLSTPDGPRHLSALFICAFLALGGVLLIAAVLTPHFLRLSGWSGKLTGIGTGVGVCGTAVFMWLRPELGIASQKVFAYFNAVALAAGCLIIQDPAGARLSTALYTLNLLFGALFMSGVELAALFVLVTSGTAFVMWHSHDSLSFICMHTAFVLCAAGGPAVLVNVLRAQLSGALELSLHEASTDPLTGLANRRGLQERAPAMLSRAYRLNEPVGLLMVDIDHFKVVNDTYGHQVGDEVLRDVADTIRSCVRGDDLVVRLGGEEMGVLTLLAAPILIQLGERIRAAVTRDCAVTVSVGVAWSEPAPGADVEEFLNELSEIADTHLYAAKNTGRNRVSHPELVG